MSCSCLQNEEGLTISYCRDCAKALEQRSPEWYQARVGFVTGSRVAKVLGAKGTRETYMSHLLAERLIGKPQKYRYVRSLEERVEMEPEARKTYEFDQNCDVLPVGFVHHPTIPRFGCSPDGLVAEDGMIEIKCLDAHNHVRLLEGGCAAQAILDEHLPQVEAGLACTGRVWCDFISYCPDLEDVTDWLHVYTVFREEDSIEALEQAVVRFLADLDGKVAAIKQRRAQPLPQRPRSLKSQLAGSLAMMGSPEKVVSIKKRRRGRQRI